MFPYLVIAKRAQVIADSSSSVVLFRYIFSVTELNILFRLLVDGILAALHRQIAGTCQFQDVERLQQLLQGVNLVLLPIMASVKVSEDTSITVARKILPIWMISFRVSYSFASHLNSTNSRRMVFAGSIIFAEYTGTILFSCAKSRFA